MKVYRDLVEDGVLVSKEIFDIAECTYTGKDMGERSITATIYFATPIDFQIGDYIKLPMQNLIRSTSGVNGSIASGSGEVEKFYIYTMPTMKKVARAMENGKAFEHTVTFYSAQYELSCVQMRDLGNSLSADEIIYTGFDSVSFNGGAKELMDRIMMVLKEAYHDSEGNPLWSYEISDSVNEEKNLALERFPISFSSNTVMDALLELNNKETINTTFFINNRKIYVGFKRPYFCRVTDGMSIDTNPSSQLFTFQYGKTSDKGVALQYGGLYDITKTVGKEVPITKLFAYGASRNLNRYYCSDRVKGGRYVNRLMLPSFDTDGKTDFIISEEALQRYGVREATKQFEEIYPSIRYATYGDIRQVKYCIKVKASGVKNENIDNPSYPVARIQCYKIVEGEIAGVNKLVEAAPPDDLAIYIHAMDKVVKVVLYGGATDAEAISKQRQHDTKVPTYTSGGSDYIPGACFIVHDRGFDEAGTVYENANRSAWFTSIDNLSGFTEKQKEEIKLNQINYTDTFWLTDLYIFQEYNQTYFSRDGYSAWSWARLNSKYTSLQGSIASDSVIVNEIVHVEPITLADTSMTAAGIDKPQSTFDIYLRDLGFTINEQNDFGDMVFLQNGTVKVSILDGLLAGQEFEISGSINSTSPSCICAFNDDGTRNEAFFAEPDYTQDGANPQTPYDAFNKGAIWRVRLNRTNVDDPDYSNLNLAMPTKEINAKSGDHLVLLDLFMPDIYIHAAENRLLREARKYLEANDNGSISYAVNFDKVRMQQIPNYAMQLREGLNLRVVDEDLNIKTENNGRYIADYRDNKLYSQRTLDNGKNIDWISANAPIDFTRSKYYIVEFSIFNSSAFDINAFNFALFKSKNEESISFVPEFTVEQEVKGMEIILKVKFQLPDNFDDGQLYYPSIYLNQLKSWYDIIDMYLISVFERDFDENTNILNYADFTIDSLTVKITDNSGNNEPIREITATLSEQTNATAWATLMNRVATTAKEGEQNRKAIEEVVNTARRNYQALLSLKDSIFDPDGSCDQVFLQVMMQQVGADSMNYQLDNTRSGLSSDGQPVLFNCSCERGSDGYYHFKVYNNDTLRHYVYTQGSQAGNWEIPVGTGLDVQLNGTDSYFVCLKCPKNDTVGQWICSTKQYAVNDPEDDGCWFFNWAILTVDSGDVYTLMETRGNAYMYGDNLVCGKISSLARNSYFDLTSGDFVLGDGTGPALEYINGVLTIRGSKGDAEDTLARLGIIEDDVSNALSAAEQAAYTNIYNGGDISVSTDGSKEIALKDAFIQLATLGCYVKFTKVSETPLPPFSKSCIIAVKKGTDVSQIYLHKDNIYAYLNWGDEYTPTEECDFYVALAEKEYIRDYLIPHAFDFIEYEMREVWTISGISVIVRTSDAIQSAMRAIANEEDARMEALAEAVSNINGGIDELQKQIDGEVSSYFYGTAPIDKDETILTDIPPFNEWAENYNLQNGVYVLKAGARNEFVNHIGDTYTNMEEYKEDSNGNTTTPFAGLSWRWCDATTVSPLPEKYITIRYTSNGSRTTKKLHWHKIADSDAVKALQEAGRAQSTADGKSTTFVLDSTKTPTNYSIGDLWILAADRTLNGTTYKKGTILTANAASATFVASHWSEKVKYIDESIAAQQAQQALDGLEIGGENLARGTKDMELSLPSAWSNGTWRKTSYSTNIDLSDDPFSIVEQGVRITCNTTNAATQVAQDNATIPLQVGDKIIISCYVKPSIEGLQLECQPIWAYHDNTSSMAGLKRQRLTLGHAGEWQKVVFDNMGSITIANNSQSLAYFYAIGATTEYVDICAVKVERGNKSTAWSPAPEDVDSKADAIKAIAEEAKEDAAESNAQLANMSNDSILTPQEKGSVADEWACIQEEYAQNSTNKTAAWGSATVAEWTTYNNAYTTLKDYIDNNLKLTDRTSNTTIVKSTFQANFANYYSANVAFLNALAIKVAELEVAAMEIGGRNLAIYSTADGANCKKNGDYGFVQTTADTNTKFDLKIQPYLNDTYGGYALVRTDIVKVGVYKFNATLTKDCDRINIGTNGVKIDTMSKFYLKETIPSGTELVISLEITNITQGSFSWKNVMIAKGTKATDWTPAPEDVDAAIEKAGYVNMYDGGDISKSYKSDDYIMSQVLCSIYSGTYKTSAVENNGFDEYQDPFNASTLVVVKSGQGRFLNGVAALYNYRDAILGTYYWGNDITVNEGVDIVVFFAQKDYIDYCISSYNDYGAEMPSGGSGIWTIKDIKIITDNATAFQIAQSKAEALDYLKAALTDGSTEIAGGLTMTNVLMLKNLEGFVTAGLSGLTKHNNLEDKVLIWGGCTYEEAYAAANNDDYNTGRGTITTLLKKDGTGKIGIFKISETQAVVKTNQGEVLIDASTDSGGIFIRNSKGENKISIKNGPLGSDFIPEEYSDSGKKSFSFSNVLCSGSSGTCSTKSSAYLWENMVETLSNGTNTVTVSFKNMSFRQMLRYMGATPTGNTTAKIRLYAQYGGGGYFPAATKTLTLQNVTSGSNYVSELTYQSFSLTHTSTSAYKYYLSVEVNGQQHYACLGDFMMQGDVEWSWHYVENSIPQTIIGTDGFATIYDNKNFFVVKNTSNGQKIFAKGLSNGSDREAGSGELYVTSSFVDAFVSFLDEFYSYVDHVRTIGSNAGNADAMQTKIKGIKNTLVDASGNRITDIIASS